MPGAVAKPGTAVNTGAKKIANKNMIAVTADARPVRPPAPTPAELSTYVVVVEVPITAPGTCCNRICQKRRLNVR